MSMHKSFTACLLLLTFQVSSAQLYGYFQPSALCGASTGFFRISLDHFKDVYTDRWGPIYCGHAGFRFYKGYYLLTKYQNFSRPGKEGLHPETGLYLKNARWNEQVLNIGLRIHPPVIKRAGSYYGFGVVFYHIDEKTDLSVFTSTFSKPQSGWGNGFFLDMGIEYFFYQQIAAFVEMEVSSGGLHGRTGFEAFSVGGFKFVAGITLYPF
jgi:hypothetical protein